jgi:transcriptional regulator with XRE-family HTH domain
VPTRTAKLYIERIGANVARLRIAQGLTQEALAEAADIAPRSVQRMERATQDVTITALVAIAEALGVPPGALLRPARLLPAIQGRPRRKRGRRDGTAATRK